MQVPCLVFVSPGEVELRPVEVGPPKAGQVQVRTTYSAVSAGTEGWCLQGRFTWQATPFPCVPGYQRVGVVERVGEGVGGFAVGQRVACTVGVFEGAVAGQWGAHAAVANTPADQVFALPDAADDLGAASLVTAQVGVNAAHRPAVDAGDAVVVYGDGIIGQFAAQAAAARGARVALAGHRPDRLRLGAAGAAGAAIDARRQDVVAEVRKFAGAETVRCVIDTVQTEAAQKQYFPLLAHGAGQIVYAGFTPATTWADMALLQQRELTAHFISGWTDARMRQTIDLIAGGAIDAASLTTHRVPFGQGPAAYRMILDKSQPFLGITFDWTGAVA